MQSSFTSWFKKQSEQICLPLLVLMLLVMNVKLPLKVVGVIIACILNRREISTGGFFKSKYLFFYFSMIAIGLINLLLGFKNIRTNYLVTVAVGLSFWLMSAVIAYNGYLIIRNEDLARVKHTISLFFTLNIGVIFLNFLWIIFETGAINPYRFKGMNQKYFISTGDQISGITFDAPVTTAFICAFGVLFFLYRRQYLLSIASMAAMLIMASNFANLVLIGVLIIAFVFDSTRVQKSFILIYMFMLTIFMARISPDNYEHVGRVYYKIINQPFDIPAEIVIPIGQLKNEPDSVLSFEQRRQKYARNYIDSMSAVTRGVNFIGPKNVLEQKIAVQSMPNAGAPNTNQDTSIVPFTRTTRHPEGKKRDTGIYRFQQSPEVLEKIGLDKQFLIDNYSSKTEDSLDKIYNWRSPGKWIAARQLFNFFKSHPFKILLGNGIANFSSRIAFKATTLQIGGRYPERFKYIHPDFLKNNLYDYLYFHARDQSSHVASNTPDAVYFQVLGEYGAVGMGCLLLLYFVFFLRRSGKSSYLLPAIILLAGAFFAEYWFEQFSIVVLFELLSFTGWKELRREGQPA